MVKFFLEGGDFVKFENYSGYVWIQISIYVEMRVYTNVLVMMDVCEGVDLRFVRLSVVCIKLGEW